MNRSAEAGLAVGARGGAWFRGELECDNPVVRRVARMSALVIFVGSGLGGLARWWLAGWIGSQAGHTFPWGTLVVNVTGSFLIGLFAALTGPEGRWVAPLMLRQFFMLGICGGYTTFSSFSLQTLQLMQEGQWLRATANTVLSVVLCLAAVGLGHALAVVLNPSKTP